MPPVDPGLIRAYQPRVRPGGFDLLDRGRATARRLFDEIVERLRWPALLVDNLSTLVAAWHPNVGRIDFPAGASPDAGDQELWRSYAISA